VRRRPSIALTSVVSITLGLLLGASSTRLTAETDSAPPVRAALLTAGPNAATPDSMTRLSARARKAAADAAQKGADVTFAILDRQTGRLLSVGDKGPFPIASVAKLFIADDLLMTMATSRRKLSSNDRGSLDVMLQSSADVPANDFWVRDGGSAIISRVAARYGLTATTVPYDGNWWNTMSTTTDLVRYYDKLLDGAGGLPSPQVALILADLAASTPKGVDGYPQRFGIPEGLFAETVAVKQGWMCCWDGPNQLHVSTGVIGADRRYVIAIGSMQPVDEAAARNTVTQVLRTMFPGGRI
jgi:hypothetical protein